MKVLGIETSCDETSMAVVEAEAGAPATLLSHIVYSQIDLHRQFGGVYPEAASREHIKKIGLVLEQTLEEASGFSQSKLKIQKSKVQLTTENSSLPAWLAANVDAIAVTAGPGLIGSLLVGVNLAKTLAFALGKPLIRVNHHEGHVMAAWLRPDSQIQKSNSKSQNWNGNVDFQLPKLPAVCLVVSGGHTKLVWMEKIGVFHELGRTRDDAAGEAFDKVARLLDLPYPGGPQISKLASEFRNSKYRNIELSSLPRPMLASGDFWFSFSGLKTAVGRVVAQQTTVSDAFKHALAYEFEEAVVDVLVAKTLAAVRRYHPKSVIVSGGVAANRRLRERMAEDLAGLADAPVLHIPPPSLCTDNGAMIAAAGAYHALDNRFDHWYDVVADDHLVMPK